MNTPILDIGTYHPNTSKLLSESTSLMKQLQQRGWDIEDFKILMHALYGVRSRLLLTLSELRDFCKYLSQLGAKPQ